MIAQERKHNKKYFFIISVFHFLALALFTRGFFLTRVELDEISTCAKSPLESKGEGDENSCWGVKPTYDRLIILIVDALRFDFAEYDEEYQKENNKPLY